MKKTMNKFDYPTAVSHTYKLYKPENEKQDNTAEQREKFKEIVQREKQIERQKVKEEQSRRKKIQQQKQKQKIQSELENKKRQLEELEKAKQLAFEQQKRSHEMAILKMEEDKKKKMVEKQKMKENKFKAQNRFVEAVQRMELEKEERTFKERQAEYRRKVIQQTQKQEREKAIKYREVVQEREKNLEEPERRTFEAFKKPLGRTAYGTVDYSKTRLHNPQIIIVNNQAEENALQKGEEEERKRKQISLERKKKDQENMRRSFERGQEAMERIKRKKQYEKYQKETEEMTLQYNMDRIKAGKKDQFIGVKPATIAQMEANKKLRGEQEFQRMFLNSDPEVFNRPATKYQIFQAKMKEPRVPEEPPFPYPVKNTYSNSALISNGKYSFESQGIQDLTTVKKDNAYELHNVQEVQEPEESMRQIGRSPPQMNVVQEYENRRQNKPDELSYSESEEDSNT